MTLTTTFVDRAADLPAAWDGLGADPWSTRRMLGVLEAAGVTAAPLRYVVVHEGDRLVAGAPLGVLAIDGQQLTHGLFRRAIAGVRHVRADFLKTRLLVCGTPLSVANPAVRCAAGAGPSALPAVRHAMEGIAARERIPWLVFKEFGPSDARAARASLPSSWLVVPSEPTATLPIRWPTPAAYLEDLRSHYRRRLRQAAARMAAAGVGVDAVPLAGAFGRREYALYDAVRGRAAVQFERLAPRFFTALGDAYPDTTFLLRFRRDGRLLGWVLLFVDGDVAYDVFHGIDYDVHASVDLYLNQLHATIQFAIAHGVRRLALGQSTETAKARVGAAMDARWIGLRHRRSAITRAMRPGARLLFPERRVPPHRVFHTTASAAP